jgi:hypothetical protein
MVMHREYEDTVLVDLESPRLKSPIGFTVVLDRASTVRSLRTLVMLGAAYSILGTAASAECVKFGPWAMTNGLATFVFDGTVLELTDGGLRPIAVMQVHRVFKGQLSERIEVHHWEGMEGPDLEQGNRYVLAIKRISSVGPNMAIPHRPFVESQDDPSLAYGTMMCGGALRDTLREDETLKGFGRGWSPAR